MLSKEPDSSLQSLRLTHNMHHPIVHLMLYVRLNLLVLWYMTIVVHLSDTALFASMHKAKTAGRSVTSTCRRQNHRCTCGMFVSTNIFLSLANEHELIINRPQRDEWPTQFHTGVSPEERTCTAGSGPPVPPSVNRLWKMLPLSIEPGKFVHGGTALTMCLQVSRPDGRHQITVYKKFISI